MRARVVYEFWGGAGLLIASTPAHGQAPVFKSTSTGNPKVQSIEAISFGPQGLLLIGDGRGSQVVAVDTGDTTAKLWSRTELKGIKDQLAGKVGTTGKGIEIQKMAVNPASHTPISPSASWTARRTWSHVDGTARSRSSRSTMSNMSACRCRRYQGHQDHRHHWAGDASWCSAGQRGIRQQDLCHPRPSRQGRPVRLLQPRDVSRRATANGKPRPPFAPSFPMRRTARNSW